MSEEFFEFLDKHKTNGWAKSLGINNDNTRVLAEGKINSNLTERVTDFFQKNWSLNKSGLFENPKYKVTASVKKAFLIGGPSPKPDSIIAVPVILSFMIADGKSNQRNVGLALRDICAYLRSENIPYEAWGEVMGPVLTKWPEEKPWRYF